jgi:hypothetical protein
MCRLFQLIGFAFLLTSFVNSAWAESCPTPAVKHDKPLLGHAKRVFIKECCEKMAETKGVSIEERSHFVSVCQKESRH